MVSNEKTKALLEGLNPTSYYRINLVEQTSSSKARESNPVSVCISQMRQNQQQLDNTEFITNKNNENSQREDNTEFLEEIGIPSGSYNNDQGSVKISGNSEYSGEKKELNRTYELEKQLVEIRQQITEGSGDNEQIDNN
ncbi:hypothetical protein LOD99_10474 [Oopsacas minuta]|uniref:Uncharacterized protein n=1 Tax=Oopsacas minuta TaxID=111878 RepID=A0AAV7KGI4_9METZ|nr:hypothetical protein LOD99_10474 [Oopsacas minuta]